MSDDRGDLGGFEPPRELSPQSRRPSQAGRPGASTASLHGAWRYMAQYTGCSTALTCDDGPPGTPVHKRTFPDEEI